jgi:hypothetical protein
MNLKKLKSKLKERYRKTVRMKVNDKTRINVDICIKSVPIGCSPTLEGQPAHLLVTIDKEVSKFKTFDQFKDFIDRVFNKTSYIADKEKGRVPFEKKDSYLKSIKTIFEKYS